MAVQALYRKWRPRSFDEIVGQEHIVSTLRNALTSGRIHHAYLFAGPRGTGKTTMARLVAKAVNCLAPEGQRPCNECDICQAVNEGRLLDLIEIDAASNTGVDDVRELRERVGFRPNQARYKVYVIDEVHMLSNAAFNALLKTLEEPPPHAIFILATTEPHKIPTTVISRCQRFSFRRIPIREIVDRLEWMTQQESLSAEREALTIIARQATGSMRDAESLLDQLASYDETGITVADVRAALGTGASEAIVDLTEALSKNDVAHGLEVINTAIDEGTDPRQFARQMVDHLRVLLLLRLESGIVPSHISDDIRPRLEEQAVAFTPRALARAVRLFNQAATEAKGGWQPQLPLEMALVEAMLSPDEKVAAPATRSQPAPASSPPPSPTSRSSSPSSAGFSSSPRPQSASTRSAAVAPAQPERSQATNAVREPESTYNSSAPSAGPTPALTIEVIQDRWSEVLNALRPRNLSLEALMRSCSPVAVEEDVVVLGFEYDFHRGKVEEEQNKRDVEDALSEMVGQHCRVRCQMAEKDQQERAAPPPQRSSSEPMEGETTPPVEPTVADDPVVRAAIEDLGAQVVGAHG
jgi:DNA polymerase-3 subunit gamma/tau